MKAKTLKVRTWRKTTVKPLPVSEERPVTRYEVGPLRYAWGAQWCVVKRIGPESATLLSNWSTEAEARAERDRLKELEERARCSP